LILLVVIVRLPCPSPEEVGDQLARYRQAFVAAGHGEPTDDIPHVFWSHVTESTDQALREADVMRDEMGVHAAAEFPNRGPLHVGVRLGDPRILVDSRHIHFMNKLHFSKLKEILTRVLGI
jgi:hypothetical protein